MQALQESTTELQLQSAISIAKSAMREGRIYICTAGILNNVFLKPKMSDTLDKSQHMKACKLCAQGLQEFGLWCSVSYKAGADPAETEDIPKDLSTVFAAANVLPCGLLVLSPSIRLIAVLSAIGLVPSLH